MIASRMAMPTYLTVLGWVCSGAWWTSARPAVAGSSPASSSGVAGSSASSVATAVDSSSAMETRAPLMRVGDEIDDGEDQDPDHVHEVPVQTGDLHLEMLLGGELAPQRDAHQGEQPQDADGDVHAVEAGENEEAAGRNAG